ncbi:hypothetical protein HDU93_007684 [Gonapodya sp. JEL0774]|nr:hypothetical protein HDU93_007684 [Gonapodya sp. JEL0774]
MASLVDPKLRAEGLGLPVSRLSEWSKYALDTQRFPEGNKFLRIQMMGPYMPMASEALYILDVEVLKDVFTAASESKLKKGRSYKIAAPIIGDGILASPWGEQWKHQRKLVEVAFRVENLKYSHKQVAKSAMRLLDRWRQRYDVSVKEGVPGWFDLRAEMLRTTMDVICQVGFGRDYESGAERAILFEMEKETYTTTSLRGTLKSASKGVELDGEPLFHVFKEVLTTMADVTLRINPMSFVSDKYKNYQQRIALLDKVVNRVIDQRLARVRSGDRGRDGTLLDAIADIDENGEPIMSRKLMGDELKTLLFAGHDTTGNALTWALYRLASNPEHLAKLRHEVDNILPAKTSFTDLERAPFLNAFIKEVLRVHPSAGFTREVEDPNGVTLGGVHLPKGSDIWFMPPVIHMQERYFERANEFLPERWEDGSKLAMDPRAYFPFSIGPRNCAGMKLAQLELRCFIAEIIRRWDIEYDGAQGAPRTYLSMTLESLYADIPRLNRAFRGHVLPFITRIPTGITVVLTDDEDEELAFLSRVNHGTEQPGFYVPFDKLSLSPLEGFITRTALRWEADRQGFATPIEKRTLGFDSSFPWRFKMGLPTGTNSPLTTASSLINLPIAARLTVPVVWRESSRKKVSVPVFRRVANLQHLILDAAESAMQRSILASWECLEVRCGDGPHGLSIERIGRAVGAYSIILDMPESNVRWDGSDVPGCRELSLEMATVKQVEGLRLERWSDLESLNVEIEALSDEDFDALILIEQLAEVEKQMDEADGVGEEAQAGLVEMESPGDTSTVKGKHKPKDSRERKVRLKNLEVMPSCQSVLLRSEEFFKSVPSFSHLVSLRIFHWYLTAEEPYDPHTVDSHRDLYNQFHSLPHRLPHLLEFGGGLYVPGLFGNVTHNPCADTNSTDSSYMRLKALCLDLPTDNESFPPAMRESIPVSDAEFWHAFGQEVGTAAPALEAVSLANVPLSMMMDEFMDELDALDDTEIATKLVSSIDAFIRGLLGMSHWHSLEESEPDEYIPRLRLHGMQNIVVEIDGDVMPGDEGRLGRLGDVFAERSRVLFSARYGLEVEVFFESFDDDMGWGFEPEGNDMWMDMESELGDFSGEEIEDFDEIYYVGDSDEDMW